MSQNKIVPYGIDLNGNIVSIKHLNMNTQYGEKCELFCPECGTPLVARRDLMNRKNNELDGWLCLAHKADTNTECNGYGERAAHLLAKEILSKSIGKEFILPPISAKDNIPHISRYKDSGSVRNGYFGYRPSKTLDRSLNYEVDDRILDTKIPMNINNIPDLEVAPELSLKIINVATEQSMGNKKKDEIKGLIPDVTLTLSNEEGREYILPVEIRLTHAKGIEDVQAYANNNQSVIEILINDLSPNDEEFTEHLSNRLLGADGYGREWLYNSRAKEKCDRKYSLCYNFFGFDVLDSFANMEFKKRGYQLSPWYFYGNETRPNYTIIHDERWAGVSKKKKFYQRVFEINIIPKKAENEKSSIYNIAQFYKDVRNVMNYKVNIDKVRYGM